jgi:large subunit ribosomal protein L5
MADKEEKKPKADKAPQGGKAERAPKPGKGEAGAKGGDKKAAVAREPESKEHARLRKQFDEAIRAKLIEQFGYKNAMQVPRIDKIVLNMGVGEGVNDRKKVETAAQDL